jgi:hypothetical protein
MRTEQIKRRLATLKNSTKYGFKEKVRRFEKEDLPTDIIS